jgi:glycosyltransferase involved in cell wall biosynthesis
VKIDLLIPTYNRANLLKDCLESVAVARHPRDLAVTVVVVDNNSSDHTKEVVQAFLELPDLSVRYVFVGRPGKSAALNDALAQTSGELVGFIDDDEQLDPSWFEVVYKEFAAASDIQFIGGQYHPRWEHEPPPWISRSYIGAIGIVLRTNRVTYSPDFPGIMMGGNAVIRRSSLQKVLPYPEHIGKIGKKIRSGEDEVIYHRLLRIGALGVDVPELIIYHWIPAERMTKKYFRKWVIGRGISVGAQLRERGFKETSMLSIPRYQFGTALRAIWPMLAARSEPDRFAAQLCILDCFATLYGRHFFGKP